MSLFALSSTVQQALQQDFKTGRWSPITLQFFEQLFRRVGGANAPTITEINNIVVTAVVPEFDFVPRVELVPGRSLGDVTPRQEALGVGLDAAPRSETVSPNFTLSSVVWP